MIDGVSAGTKLFHKYLGEIIVVELTEALFTANTNNKGILPFAYYDFGKVIFYEDSHSNNTFKSFEEYVEFSEQEKKKRTEIEAELELQRLQKEQMQERIRREREKAEEVERQRKEQQILERKRIEQQRIERQKIFQQTNIQATVENQNQINKPFTGFSIFDFFAPKREELFKIKEEQKNKVKEIIEKRKIEYLLHFTRIENLSSILKYGLIPVSRSLSR